MSSIILSDTVNGYFGFVSVLRSICKKQRIGQRSAEFSKILNPYTKADI